MKLWTNTFSHRVLGKGAFGAAMLACALAGAFSGTRDAAPAPIAQADELPRHWQGAAVRPLARSGRPWGPPRNSAGTAAASTGWPGFRASWLAPEKPQPAARIQCGGNLY